MKYLMACAAMALIAGPAFADGHTEGRLGAVLKIVGNEKNRAITDEARTFVESGATEGSPTERDVLVITSIVGDKGRGNGSEAFVVPDHDPAGGFNSDPD